jgi:NADH-quinone oxidoreductase subunit K
MTLFGLEPLHCCLIFSALLFSTGLAAVLLRSNAIFTLLGVELMLNAANVNFIAFWRFSSYGDGKNTGAGVLFVIFSIAVAAAEAAVGLALIIAIYRHKRGIRLEDAATLRG